MDVLERITELCNERGWNYEALSRESGVPASTISGLYQRQNSPQIATLETLCNGFGITMSEFFAPDGKLTALTDEQRDLLDRWNVLSDKHKALVLELMDKL